MTAIELRGVLDGGRYFEGPRWHAGKLWFVDCMERTLLSLDLSGRANSTRRLRTIRPAASASCRMAGSWC